MKTCLLAVFVVTGSLVVPAAATAEEIGARVFRGVDAATGARVAVEVHMGAVSLTIDHPSVTIRKDLRNGLTVTTLKAGREELALTLSRSLFLVSGTRGRVEAGAAHPDRVSAAQAMIGASTAARRAEALIARLSIAPGSPLRHTLLATRTLLLSASGRPGDRTDIVSSTRTLRAATAAARVATEEEGPGECWTEYAKEAISAYMEYEQCMASEQWWDLLGQAGCAVIYEMRAIGAFSWWVSCVGLRG